MSFQTCISFFQMLNTKEDILNIFWGTKQFLVLTDFHSMESNTNQTVGGPGWVNDDTILILGELSL